MFSFRASAGYHDVQVAEVGDPPTVVLKEVQRSRDVTSRIRMEAMATSSKTPIEVQRVKGVAIPVVDSARAEAFYGSVLGLARAQVDGEQSCFALGDAILMLKAEWYARPTREPSPRITLEVDDAAAMERTLRERGVEIANPVETYGSSRLGSFVDSEGNLFWFCSTT